MKLGISRWPSTSKEEVLPGETVSWDLNTFKHLPDLSRMLHCLFYYYYLLDGLRICIHIGQRLTSPRRHCQAGVDNYTDPTFLSVMKVLRQGWNPRDRASSPHLKWEEKRYHDFPFIPAHKSQNYIN